MPERLRPAVTGDWPAITGLLEQHRLPLDGAYAHLAHFIVAEGDEGIRGVAGLEVYGEAALLRSVAVATPGHGLGTRLIEYVLAHARTAGVRDLVLLTTTAGSFFPRFGFTQVEREAVPPALQASMEFRGACPSSALVMHRTLRREELS